MRDRGDSVITEEEEDKPAGVFNFGGDDQEDDDMTTGATTTEGTIPRIPSSRPKPGPVVGGVYLMGDCAVSVPPQNNEEELSIPTPDSEPRRASWSVVPVEDFGLVRSQVRSTDQVFQEENSRHSGNKSSLGAHSGNSSVGHHQPMGAVSTTSPVFQQH